MEAYHVENFGCRASRSDGEAIAAGLRHRGLLEASAAETAHLVIVNTCSVTAEADRTARAFIRGVRRRNPHARIVVTGCYAQRAPQEVAALEGVAAVIGNSHKGLVAEVAASLQQTVPSLVPLSSLTHAGVPVYVDDTFAHAELASLPFAADAHQTRPNLKVQEGCGNRCSFCVIPATRGPSRSVPLPISLEDVRRFVDAGGQELVLSGINLGRWGRDLVPARGFVDLIAGILHKSSLPRLRLSSIEPMDWTAELLAWFREFAVGAHPRIAPHAHLPLQSGSDTILRKMHRRYRPWHYAERVQAIRAALPDAAIGADVMVGFPGETDALFEESYRFIAAQPFSYLHLFPFSPRPGTPGWDLHREFAVPSTAVNERMAAMRGLAATKNKNFRSRLVGKQLSALTLATAKEVSDRQCTSGISENFVPVEIAGGLPPNQLLRLRITGLTAQGVTGEIHQP